MSSKSVEEEKLLNSSQDRACEAKSIFLFESCISAVSLHFLPLEHPGHGTETRSSYLSFFNPLRSRGSDKVLHIEHNPILIVRRVE